MKSLILKNRLQHRLLWRVALIAFFSGLLFSSIQIYLDYKSQKELLNSQIQEIISTSKKAAAHVAWNLDPDSAREVLLGVLEHKIVVQAEIRDDLDEVIAVVKETETQDQKNEAFLFNEFHSAKEDLYIHDCKHIVGREDRIIGTLALAINAETISQGFIVRTGQILFADLLRIVLLVALLLYVFNLTLTRSLVLTGKRLREINPASPGSSEIPIPSGHADDELGILIQDLNSLLTSVQENIKHRTQAEQKLKTLNQELEEKVKTRTSELSRTLDDLQATHEQLKISQSTILQQDKMASIGQLAAGVAHEINNPMGFISSNLSTLGKYREKLFSYIESLEEIIAQTGENAAIDNKSQLRKKHKIDILAEDIIDLLDESLDGASRVKEIVQNLKGFSRVDQAQEAEADLNDCLDKTLSIAWNEIKYKARVEKDYAELPAVLCFPQQLNQVFLNLMVNAAHAIDEDKEGVIRIVTRQENDRVSIVISDNGCGIPEENLERLFEPFFTTKEVGKGTGLGLSIAYDIVTKHGGELKVASKPGEGTSFTVLLQINKEEKMA